jgi:hypothetical protein
MYSFFTKKVRELSAIPIIDFGLLAMVVFFAGKKELQMQRDKDALKKANPGMKITVKAYQGRFGATWNWSLEEKKVVSPTASDRTAPSLQQETETSQNTNLGMINVLKPPVTETKKNCPP